MVLKELINIEEKLLLYEKKNKYTIDFNQYVKFEEALKYVGNITSMYFKYINEYYNDVLHKKKELTKDEKKSLLEAVNAKILETEIDINEETLNIIHKFI